jgi:hypothetical protein
MHAHISPLALQSRVHRPSIDDGRLVLADVTCPKCGATNPGGTSWCLNDGAFLWPDEDPDPPDLQIASDIDEAGPPEVRVEPDRPVLDLRDGVTVAVQVRNLSAVRDSYLIDLVELPAWLTGSSSNEVTLPPQAAASVSIHIGVPPGLFLHHQRVPFAVRVRSRDDVSTCIDTPIELLVPRLDRGLRLHAVPDVAVLADTAEGIVRVTVDNAGSNFPRRVSLSASDPDHAVRCTCTPSEIDLAANARAIAEVRFTVPALPPGLAETRLLTVAVDEHGRAPITTTITVEQSTAPASDHTGSIDDAQTVVAAVGFDVPSKPLAFTDPGLESLAGIAAAQMRLEPEVVQVPERRRGEFLVVVDNSEGMEPLHIGLARGDDDDALSYDFQPSQFDIPAGQVVASTLVVQPRRRGRDDPIERIIRVQAFDDAGSSIECEGTLVSSGWDKWRIASIVLPLAGGVMALGGVVAPWTRNSNYYGSDWFERLTAVAGLPGSSLGQNSLLAGAWLQAEPSLSQPVGRCLVMLLALIMAFGIAGLEGLVVRAAALALLVTIFGYGIYTLLAPLPVATGGLTYGLYLVILGGLLGYAGGVLAKR